MFLINVGFADSFCLGPTCYWRLSDQISEVVGKITCGFKTAKLKAQVSNLKLRCGYVPHFVLQFWNVVVWSSMFCYDLTLWPGLPDQKSDKIFQVLKTLILFQKLTIARGKGRVSSESADGGRVTDVNPWPLTLIHGGVEHVICEYTCWKVEERKEEWNNLYMSIKPGTYLGFWNEKNLSWNVFHIAGGE